MCFAKYFSDIMVVISSICHRGDQTDNFSDDRQYYIYCNMMVLFLCVVMYCAVLLGFSRTVSIVYSCSIMALLLRVQLNVVGGYMFIDSLHQQSGKVSFLKLAHFL